MITFAHVDANLKLKYAMQNLILVDVNRVTQMKGHFNKKSYYLPVEVHTTLPPFLARQDNGVVMNNVSKLCPSHYMMASAYRHIIPLITQVYRLLLSMPSLRLEYC